MPPGGSTRVATVVEHEGSALAASLPHAVLQLIFAQLPVDLRARCACVCRGWRAAVSERTLWTALDVSRTSGVSVAVTDAVLCGAAARAGGELKSLDVSGSVAISLEELLAVATANAATLQQLHVRNSPCYRPGFGVNRMLRLDDAEALLQAAPQLRLLDADVCCASVADARCALSGEGLLAPLRAHGLRVTTFGAAEDDVLTLAADVASHAWLQELRVHIRPLPAAAVEAFVDAALARRLTGVSFCNCRLTAASTPALARLLGGNAVSSFAVWEHYDLESPDAALLAGALRANSTLTSLTLGWEQFWHNAAALSTLLGGVTAHPSLRTLSLGANTTYGGDLVAAGVALGALLAANAPALTELDVAQCHLEDAGLTPLFKALRRNTHLRMLRYNFNEISEAFARDVLLPAVRANASLRALHTDRHWPSELEAEDIVNGRAAADDR
jgi:hypothetical protein